MHTYTMQDFMYYPSIAYRLSMLLPPQWSESQHRLSHSLPGVLRRAVFAMATVNLMWQNIGMVLYMLMPTRIADADDDTALPLVAEIAETGGIMCLTLLGAGKLGMLLWYNDRIVALLAEFEAIFPSAATQCHHDALFRVPHFAVATERLLRGTMVFFAMACCFYNALPLVELAVELLISDKHFLYRYQSNTWYPWQAARGAVSWPSFCIAYLCQMQSSLAGLSAILASDFLFCFFVTQMQLHYDYLANALQAIDATSAGANAQLKHLIAHHSHILRHSKEINAIFNFSFTVNIMTSAIAICLMGFSMLMISPAHACKYSVGLLSFIVFMFFICHNGSALTMASERLPLAAFGGNWYAGDGAYRRMLLLVTMRSAKSNVLRAFDMPAISMETFMAILKLSYQLFTFIRAMG